jgi:hypothetical protein
MLRVAKVMAYGHFNAFGGLRRFQRLRDTSGNWNSAARGPSPDRFVSELLNNTASHPCAASTEGRWMIRVIVTSGMNHQRVALDVNEFEPGCQYRIACITHGIYEHCGQIAEMPITPRQAMALACRWIEMPSRSQCRHHLPVLLLGLAAWVFVHMEAMQPLREPGKRGAEYDTIGCFTDNYLANRFADSLLVNSVHWNSDISLCGPT